ncbi:hypothetical protein ON010_g18199 [Phytophthora cinnamomi]|nr:hypothetical protein ON010_g18199 [Phytophthora cinnamomi]
MPGGSTFINLSSEHHEQDAGDTGGRNAANLRPKIQTTKTVVVTLVASGTEVEAAAERDTATIKAGQALQPAQAQHALQLALQLQHVQLQQQPAFDLQPSYHAPLPRVTGKYLTQALVNFKPTSTTPTLNSGDLTN